MQRQTSSTADSVSLPGDVSNIKVVVRIRPLSSKESAAGNTVCCEPIDNVHLAIRKSGSKKAYLQSQSTDVVGEFAFDRVFGPLTRQDEVYLQSVYPYLPKLLAGEHVTVLAYGATGAGKTHTMFGNDIAKQSKGEGTPSTTSMGLIPQCLRDVCQMIETKRQESTLGEVWNLSFGFFEVYNDQVFDLIEYTGKNLPVREDSEKGLVHVVGLKESTVESPDEIIDLIVRGQKMRKMEPTMANVVSSRSHAVIQVIARHITRNKQGRELLMESKLSLIDLAGSERASATNNRGIRLQEGANINKSLLALANCINALAENTIHNKKSNVKYRDSKLTHILRTSLEGNCNLVMVSNINPSDGTYEDSLHTLQYANRAKNIKVNPTTRELVLDSSSLEREVRLREENDVLRLQIDEMATSMRQIQEENASLQAELAAALAALSAAKPNNSTSAFRRITFGFGRSSVDRNSLSPPKMSKSISSERQSIGDNSFGTPKSRGSLCSESLSPKSPKSPKSVDEPESPESPESLVDTLPELQDDECEHNNTDCVSSCSVNVALACDDSDEGNVSRKEQRHSTSSRLSNNQRIVVPVTEHKKSTSNRSFFSLFLCGSNDAVTN